MNIVSHFKEKNIEYSISTRPRLEPGIHMLLARHYDVCEVPLKLNELKNKIAKVDHAGVLPKHLGTLYNMGGSYFFSLVGHFVVMSVS